MLRSLNLPYSPQQIDELKDELYRKARELRSRELPEEVFALFIDAYNCQIKDEETKRVRKAVIYSCIGIDMEGKKSLFGYYVLYGSESRGGWLQILNDMIHRGMKKVMILVSDDFPGLQQAVKSLLPGTDHQLCFVRLQRNVRRNMSKHDAKIFNQELTRIRLENDYDNALIRSEELCKHLHSKYPIYIKALSSKKELYLSFL